MQRNIADLMGQALAEAQRRGLLPDAEDQHVVVERPQNPDHGDFASSLPLKLARPMRTSPIKIAETLVPLIPPDAALHRVWAAPPGFVNFALDAGWLADQVSVIRGAADTYGKTDIGAGKRVQVEFVSVNPTGPIHVGHARGAVFGSALANVLKTAGYDVEREYYLNDTGNQMARFNESLYARYKQLFGQKADVPPDGYPGEHMIDLAQEIRDEVGGRFLDMPEAEAIDQLGELGLQRTVAVIQADMDRLRVSYDVWFSERSLYDDGKYEKAMAILGDGGYLTNRDGAKWFASSSLGEDKDSVLVRSTGAPTYFASDVAYHYNKFLERKFDRVINVWGADHQGHVPRMKAVATALGVSPDRLNLILYQLVTLKRGGETVRVSKRTGDLVTLRELVEEVGPDACRYFFLSRSPESQMEFDLELAKKQSDENPVYYIQYAHARTAGILREAAERGIGFGDGDLPLLTHDAELALIRKMLVLPELIETMAQSLEPHHLPHYAVELATAFHWFYERCRVVSSVPEDSEITKARLKLVEAAKIVLSRCLRLMIMEAPERM